MRFDAADLDKETQLLTNFLRNRGYYNLAKENFYYLVDSSLHSHQVDIELMFRDIQQGIPDSTQQNNAFRRYKINKVTIVSGIDVFDRDSKLEFATPDTVNYKG